MAFRIVKAEQLEREEYERFPGRFRAALTELAGLRHMRANLIRHQPGAVGPRHAERVQDETFVPLRGTLTMYLGDPPERHECVNYFKSKRPFSYLADSPIFAIRGAVS